LKNIVIIANACFELGYWPDYFKKLTTIVIPKPNKSSYNSLKSFRPIVLLNTIGKLIEKVIGDRLQFQVISNNFIVISQTLKHVQDMFNFNITSNPCGYWVLFVSKTPLVVWYFIMDLIPPKVLSYYALFESKSIVIFICIHCLIISFKLCKFTWTLHKVFPSSNLNSYIVFH